MRTIAVLLHHAVRIFDYGVIHEVFGVDRSDDHVPAMSLWRCSPGRTPVSLPGGATLAATHDLEALARADLVLVPGGEPAPPRADAAEVRALRAAADAGVPIAALCSGAFLLGDAGLLDGRRATTHWRLVDALTRSAPDARIESGPLWISDGPILTAAGTAAGIDLCLHLVRRAHGAAVAATIARRMVTPPHRDGDQAQYVPAGAGPLPDALTDVLAWARDHLHEPLTVAVLARRAQQSPRTFARRFAETTGSTPLRWLHHQRVQLAQELMERTDLPVEEVARRAGFGTTAVLRRHFGRDLGTTPTAYRRRFATPT
ncbi:transcriptional regulator, AraC family with amidase-like domain [Micromonospora pattaloongensis]|uniref:Transcriptional regulator, AraC family with amidase-like domain n=1 Tax=Micromonospora pattaloongensis TaxID=405436 RepID=A0A1H3KSF2_9ACTN|nr:helix-turn-helix domain-containing protein [Micromonospora pattaloongensis]SDY54604.1 transcriptional regulator, AraC family with amidase-like domain [Micromonospora pattaloongensis]